MSEPESKGLTRAHWLVLAAAFTGWMFDGLEMGLFPIVARPALQDLLQVTDDTLVGQWNGYIVAVFLFGAAAGGFLFGWLGDKIGRVRSMMLSILCYSLFTGCCCFAQYAWQLAGFRFLAALGMGGEWALGVALVMECWPEKLRPLLAGIIGAAANCGFLLIAVVGRMFPVTVENWRWMFLVGAVPALLTIFIRIFVPESEKWKESVKESKASPVREIFSPALLKPTLLAITFASIALIGTWGAVSGFLPLWTDALAGGDVALSINARVGATASDLAISKATIVVADDGTHGSPGGENAPKYTIKSEYDLNSSGQPGDSVTYRLKVTNRGAADGSGVVMTAIVPVSAVDPASVSTTQPDQVTFDADTGELKWTIGELKFKNPAAKATSQIVISIGAIIGCLVAPLVGGWIGRRIAYFGLCLSSLLVCAFLFRTLTEYNVVFLIVSGLAGMTTAAFYGWLPLYLPELFPTRVRATGQGLSFNFGRILAAFGAIYAGQLVAFHEQSHPGEGFARSGATITLVYLIGMVVIWFAPETKGKPLPD